LCPLDEAHDYVIAGDVAGINLRKDLLQSISMGHDFAVCYGYPLIGIFVNETRVVARKHAR